MIRAILRLFVLSFVGVLLVGCGLVVLARGAGWQLGPTYYLVALTPYAGALALAAAVVALLLRTRLLALVGVILFAVVAVWWAPMFWPDRPDTPESGLRVMTANLGMGSGDAEAVVAAVEAHRVDLLAVQELTEESAAELRAAGLDHLLPHSFQRPGEGAVGSGIWSRNRMTRPVSMEGTISANLSAVVDTAGGPMRFVAVHPMRADLFAGDSGANDRQIVNRYLLATTGPTIVAGDFNATWDNQPIRELVSNGFVDAADSAGAGLVRTWPAGLGPWPPVVGIDHVLSWGLPSARTVDVIPIPGSDHLGLVAGF